MRDTMMIGDKAVSFEASALTPIEYRAKTGRDLISETYKLRNSKAPTTDMYDASLSLAHVMAMDADPSTPDKRDDWIKSFDVFPADEVISFTQRLYAKASGRTSKAKKKKFMKQSGQ